MKKLKPNISIALKMIAIVILIAGVYVFKLPELTLQELAGCVSLVTLLLVVQKWVR